MLFAIAMFAENAIYNMFHNFWMPIVLPLQSLLLSAK